MEKQILNQLRKQNAILADILNELKRINLVDVSESKTTYSNNNEGVNPPKLLDNEKTLEVCHVVKNGSTYTYNKGRMISVKEATPADFYMYREDK